MWRCGRCGWLNPSDAKACTDCDKRKPRAKKPLPRPSFRPWRCVVLALDAAERTGWSVWVLGKLASSGEFKIYTDDGVREVIRVVDVAKSFALRHGVPWVAIVEASWGGHMGLGKSAAHGYWSFALRNAQLPRARIGSVQPSRWRARTLPKGMHCAKRDVVRPAEVVAARAEVDGHTVGDDEAPAILIGKWGTFAGEVGLMLGTKEAVTI